MPVCWKRCSSQTWFLGPGSAHGCSRGKRSPVAAETLDFLLTVNYMALLKIRHEDWDV